MSDSDFNKCKRPTWWARIECEDSDGEIQSKFLTIKYVAADCLLDVTCECHPGITVYIGAGKGQGQVRETIVTVEL